MKEVIILPNADYYRSAAAAVKEAVSQGKEPNANTLFDVKTAANTLNNDFCRQCKDAVDEYTRFKNRQ